MLYCPFNGVLKKKRTAFSVAIDKLTGVMEVERMSVEMLYRLRESLRWIFWSGLIRKQVTVFAACGIFCSGCVTLSVSEYETVALSESFEADATRIIVRAPVRRYRDSFYNVDAGQYQVRDTEIGKTETVRADRSAGPERTIVEDDSLWNLLINGDLTIEKVAYDQYRVDDTSGFSFRVADNSRRGAEARCVRNTVSFENEETGRFAVGVGEISDDEAVQRYGEWLASRLSCSVKSGTQEWVLTLFTSKASEPSIEINRAGKKLVGRVLDYAVADAPGIGGRLPVQDPGLRTSGNRFAGVSISQAGEQLAAVSMARGNSTIWLGATSNVEEQPMLVATGYALILNDWLTN